MTDDHYGLNSKVVSYESTNNNKVQRLVVGGHIEAPAREIPTPPLTMLPSDNSVVVTAWSDDLGNTIMGSSNNRQKRYFNASQASIQSRFRR